MSEINSKQERYNCLLKFRKTGKITVDTLHHTPNQRLQGTEIFTHLVSDAYLCWKIKEPCRRFPVYLKAIRNQSSAKLSLDIMLNLQFLLYI
jgi:hypothetical protein